MSMARRSEQAARLPGDRRKRGARYILLADAKAQQALLTNATDSFRRMEKRGEWEAPLPVGVPIAQAAQPAPATPRRFGFGRRARPETRSSTVTVVMPAAVSHAWTAIQAAPARVAGLTSCPEARRLADALAAVASSLVQALSVVPDAERPHHPAYRALLQIAAELDALCQALPTLPRCNGQTPCMGAVQLQAPQTAGVGRRADDPVLMQVLAQLRTP